MYLKPITIGNLKIENNIFLAPMAGITDLPFRKLCKNYGAGLVYTQMVSAKGIFYGDKKTKTLLKTEGEKRPIAMQIFGSDVESMGVAAEKVSKIADILDINMGCPAPKVVKNGDGSRLLLNLDLIGDIVSEVVKKSSKPVSVKIRKGWDEKSIVAVEAAKVIEQAGASMITIHGRTKEEYYSGKVDLEIIKKVKEAVNIPVIGNGDIKQEEDAERMFEYTGVDGIMIGRGAIGNPWIFKKIIYYLENGEKLPEVSLQERLEIITKHIEMAVEEKPENIAIREMRKHISWYTKGMKNSSFVREYINRIEEIDYHDLLEKSIEKKRQGYRLSQACAAYSGGKLELSYSFADDETLELVTFRLVIDKETEIISLSEVIPYAAFYENEMKELFGVNIQLIEPDYKNKLYRINAETPFVPKGE